MDKNRNFSNKVFIIDGFEATGKSILPPIIDGFKNTLFHCHSYELEWHTMLWHKKEISSSCFQSMIRNICDYRIYNNLLGREINTRLSDLSCVLKSPKIFDFLKRIINSNDIELYTNKKEERKSLVLSLYQNFGATEQYKKALGDRLFFAEFVRDPIYRFLQLKIKDETVISGDRRKDFTLRKYNKNNNILIEYYFEEYDFFTKKTYENKDEFLLALIEEQLNQWRLIFSRTDEEKHLLLIPFEQLVFNPTKILNEISIFLCEDWRKCKSVRRMLTKESIPRKSITATKPLPIFQRYGLKEIKGKTITEERANYLDFLRQDYMIPENYIEKLIFLSNSYYSWLKEINQIDHEFIPEY